MSCLDRQFNITSKTGTGGQRPSTKATVTTSHCFKKEHTGTRVSSPLVSILCVDRWNVGRLVSGRNLNFMRQNCYANFFVAFLFRPKILKSKFSRSFPWIVGFIQILIEEPKPVRGIE